MQKTKFYTHHKDHDLSINAMLVLYRLIQQTARPDVFFKDLQRKRFLKASAKDLANLFTKGLFTERQINLALTELQNKGFIESKFLSKGYDRTLWHAVDHKIFSKEIAEQQILQGI